ncbi:MAG: hypothetical protein EXR75_03705 [Myxococcales bacterium]|nr:hypothetical protein [Myxococcales bacterium]
MVSPARYLLDSSYLSAAQRDPAIGGRLLDSLADCAIASVVLHELSYGVAHMPAGQKRRLLADYRRVTSKNRPAPRQRVS